MSFNQLKALPSQLSSLVSLRNLWLDNNKLPSIPTISALSSLRTLTLHNNALTETTCLIPLRDVKCLMRVTLQNNQFADNQLRQLDDNGSLMFIHRIGSTYNEISRMSYFYQNRLSQAYYLGYSNFFRGDGNFFWLAGRISVSDKSLVLHCPRECPPHQQIKKCRNKQNVNRCRRFWGGGHNRRPRGGGC